MSKRLLIGITYILFCLSVYSQDYNQLTDTGEFTQAGSNKSSKSDTLSSGNKEIPKGLKVWTIDERFGERTAAVPDTMQHMYMNSIFTTGLRGEYNTTGNLGAPRISRIFIDRDETSQFVFTQPYDYFLTPVNKFLLRTLFRRLPIFLMMNVVIEQMVKIILRQFLVLMQVKS